MADANRDGDDPAPEPAKGRTGGGPQSKPLSHEIRIEILTLVAVHEQLSPVAAAKELDRPLGTVAYHVRELADRGLIHEVDSRQRRGATEHFYAINPEYPDWDETLDDVKSRMSALKALAKTVASFKH